MKKLLIIALVVFVFLGSLTLPALAEQKIKRGSKNVLLGWTEIPKTIVRVTKDSDNPFLGLTVGLLKGIANAFAKTASGAHDVVTFPIDSENPGAVKDEMIPVGKTK